MFLILLSSFELPYVSPSTACSSGTALTYCCFIHPIFNMSFNSYMYKCASVNIVLHGYHARAWTCFSPTATSIACTTLSASYAHSMKSTHNGLNVECQISSSCVSIPKMMFCMEERPWTPFPLRLRHYSPSESCHLIHSKMLRPTTKKIQIKILLLFPLLSSANVHIAHPSAHAV